MGFPVPYLGFRHKAEYGDSVCRVSDAFFTVVVKKAFSVKMAPAGRVVVLQFFRLATSTNRCNLLDDHRRIGDFRLAKIRPSFEVDRTR
jgi:hypothetical protein